MSLNLTTNNGRYLADAEVRKRCMEELRRYASVCPALSTLEKRRAVLDRALASEWARFRRNTVISYFARNLALAAVATDGWEWEPTTV